MFAGAGDDLRAARDRALLLVGFAGALRRSELVGLRFENVRFTDDGLVVTIPKSKTDQEGEGQTVGIPYGSHPESCPVRALAAWLERSGIPSGYLFPAIGRWGGELEPATSLNAPRTVFRLKSHHPDGWVTLPIRPDSARRYSVRR